MSKTKLKRKHAAVFLICFIPLILSGCSAKDYIDAFIDPLVAKICAAENPIVSAIEDAFINNSVVNTMLNAYGLDSMRLMLRTCAYGIAGLLCLINIADDMMSTFQIRAFVKGATKYAVTYAVIEHSFSLAKYINWFGTALISKVMSFVDTTSSMASPAEVKTALIDQFGLSQVYGQASSGASGFEYVGDIIGSTFGAIMLNSVIYTVLLIALQVVSIQCLMQCYSAVIEIALLESFLPIGISWLASDGFRGRGGRYLRRLFSSFIKVALFGIVCLLCKSIGNISIESGIMTYMTFMLLIGFSAVGLMKGCGPIADTIMGI